MPGFKTNSVSSCRSYSQAKGPIRSYKVLYGEGPRGPRRGPLSYQPSPVPATPRALAIDDAVGVDADGDPGNFGHAVAAVLRRGVRGRGRGRRGDLGEPLLPAAVVADRARVELALVHDDVHRHVPAREQHLVVAEAG